MEIIPSGDGREVKNVFGYIKLITIQIVNVFGFRCDLV
jgi:hypothetical protein